MLPLRRRSFRPGAHPERGFTLLEVVVVAVLIGVIATLASQRFGAVVTSRQRSEVRRFATTWESLFNEALLRGEGYRLVIDLDANTYFVRREIKAEPTEIRKVDRLKNLRTRSERARRERREDEELESATAEYEAEEQRQGGALDTLFYEFVYADPNGPVKLTRPLEFPQLADPKALSAGLTFDSVKTASGEVREGRVNIQFSPRGGSSFAAVYIRGEGKTFTIFMNPSTGGMSIHDRIVDYEWTLGRVDN